MGMSQSRLEFTSRLWGDFEASDFKLLNKIKICPSFSTWRLWAPWAKIKNVKCQLFTAVQLQFQGDINLHKDQFLILWWMCVSLRKLSVHGVRKKTYRNSMWGKCMSTHTERHNQERHNQKQVCFLLSNSQYFSFLLHSFPTVRESSVNDEQYHIGKHIHPHPHMWRC